MADFHEFSLSASTFQTLLALEEVGEWRKEVTDSVRKEQLKPSSVHTRTGDVVNTERRVSYTRPGRSQIVFDLLEDELLHELSADMKGALAVYRGHYDFVYYSPGGFFAKHVDHVNAYGPGLCCWHVLVCLDAEACEGGQTLVYSEAAHASSASVTPGGVLAIRSGVPHAGSLVEKGRKVLLKFDLFQFQDDSLSRKNQPDEMVACECHDGVCHMERGPLLRQPFFERMMAFEGPREVLRLGGFSVSECQALRRFLAGDDSLARDAADVAKAHEVLGYILAPEASMTFSEFRNVCTDEYVLTKDRRAARRLAAMANDEYAFLGVIQSWSIHTQEVWDLCLDYGTTEVFTSSVCVLSEGSVIMLTEPGPRWQSGKEIGQIDLPELNKEVFIFEDPSPQSIDTFATMDAMLKKQVCVSSADYWKLQETPCENLKPPATPRRTSLSALDATKLTKLLVRNTPRDDFRSVLESCVGMARFSRELVEDACNDGESFLTTTMYESRVYEFEWLLMKKRALQPAH